MRAHEFSSILLEYRREDTVRALGDRMWNTFVRSHAYGIPDNLQGAHALATMAVNPETYPEKPIIIPVLGKSTTISPASAPELAQRLKPQILQAILAAIESKDPTPNKSYTPWLAQVWTNPAGTGRLEDLNRHNALGIYEIAKRRGWVPLDKRNIRDFKTYHDFETWMHGAGIFQRYDEYEEQRQQKNMSRGQSETVYEDSDVRIVVPKDVDAACYYGQGTRWCTAATRGENYFEHYNRNGKLYILLPKHPTRDGEKYQLHFQSNQFMDENDESVDLLSLEKKFPKAFEYFTKAEPDITKYVVFANDTVLETIFHRIAEHAQQLALEEIFEWEAQDPGFHHWQARKALRKGYVLPEAFEKKRQDEDYEFTENDIDWDRVHEDDDLNYFDYNDDAPRILKEFTYYTKLSANGIKELADSTPNNDENEPWTVFQLENLLAQAVKENSSNQDFARYIAKNLETNVVVRLNRRSGSTEYRTDSPNSKRKWQLWDRVGPYEVGLMYGQTK